MGINENNWTYLEETGYHYNGDYKIWMDWDEFRWHVYYKGSEVRWAWNLEEAKKEALSHSITGIIVKSGTV